MPRGRANDQGDVQNRDTEAEPGIEKQRQAQSGRARHREAELSLPAGGDTVLGDNEKMRAMKRESFLR